MFADRVTAGRELARALEKLRPDKPLVLGLPRGGVVVGAEIARALACDLDVMLVKKLRAPHNPELAIGAVCEEGRPYLNHEVVSITSPSKRYLEGEINERLLEMATQRHIYRAVKPRISPANRVAVLVDDGLATGATMIAAVQASGGMNPARLIVAVPVSPPETIAQINKMPAVDELVCLDTPAWFGGVGQFYDDFTQVSDDEVVAILKQFAGLTD